MRKIGVILIIIVIFLLSYEVYGAEEDISYSIEETLTNYDDTNYEEDGEEDEMQTYQDENELDDDDMEDDLDDGDVDYEEDEDYEEDDDVEDDGLESELQENIDNETEENVDNEENESEEEIQNNFNTQTRNNIIEEEQKEEVIPQETIKETQTINDSEIPHTGMNSNVFHLIFIMIMALGIYSGIQYKNLKIIK